jgi:hypothetical protein
MSSALIVFACLFLPRAQADTVHTMTSLRGPRSSATVLGVTTSCMTQPIDGRIDKSKSLGLYQLQRELAKVTWLLTLRHDVAQKLGAVCGHVNREQGCPAASHCNLVPSATLEQHTFSNIYIYIYIYLYIYISKAIPVTGRGGL